MKFALTPILSSVLLFAVGACDLVPSSEQGEQNMTDQTAELPVLFEDESVVIRAGEVPDTDFVNQYPNRQTKLVDTKNYHDVFRASIRNGQPAENFGDLLLTSRLENGDLVVFPTIQNGGDLDRSLFLIEFKKSDATWSFRNPTNPYSWFEDPGSEELAKFKSLLKECEAGDKTKQTDLVIQSNYFPDDAIVGPGLYSDTGERRGQITCEDQIYTHMDRFAMVLDGEIFVFTAFFDNKQIKDNPYGETYFFVRKVD